MEDNDESHPVSLEVKAKKLLEWKLTGKGDTPNPFRDLENISDEIDFLIKKGYLSTVGSSAKDLMYLVTKEGRRYIFGQ